MCLCRHHWNQHNPDPAKVHKCWYCACPDYCPKMIDANLESRQKAEAYLAHETAALRARLQTLQEAGNDLADRLEVTDKKLREQEAELARLRKGLAKIVEQQPKDEPEEKDGHWGNEDDAEYHGYKCAAWFLGEIAREALSPDAGEPKEKK